MEPTSKLVLCESKERRDIKREGEREERGGKEKEESKHGCVLGEKKRKRGENEWDGRKRERAKKGRKWVREKIYLFFS